MKKLLILVLTFILLFSVACSSREEQPQDTPDDVDRTVVNNDENAPDDIGDKPDENAENSANTAPAKDYVIAFSDGRSVMLGQSSEDALASLGEYSDMLEAPSCIHDGYDRVYSFAGFSVTTSPDENGIDRVTEVGIETAECVLSNGLTTGSSVADMEAAYGTDCTNSFGFYTYTIGQTQISFVTEDDVIMSILFSGGGGR